MLQGPHTERGEKKKCNLTLILLCLASSLPMTFVRVGSFVGYFEVVWEIVIVIDKDHLYEFVMCVFRWVSCVVLDRVLVVHVDCDVGRYSVERGDDGVAAGESWRAPLCWLNRAGPAIIDGMVE